MSREMTRTYLDVIDADKQFCRLLHGQLNDKYLAYFYYLL